MRRVVFFSLLLSLCACGSSSKGNGNHETGDGDSTKEDAGKMTGDGDGDTTPDAGNGLANPQLPIETPFKRRPFTMTGLALSYSPYRDGQSPVRETPNGGGMPTAAQILEDMKILERNWQGIRMYASGDVAEAVVKVIDDNKIKIKVLLGAWIAPETDAASQQGNEDEVAHCLKIAKDHPNVVAAISVGNETQVDWSTHKVPMERIQYFVRKVRAASKLPVAVADNWAWWRTFGGELAAEIDFIVLHTYPLWENYDIDTSTGTPDTKAIDYTKGNWHSVADQHTDMPVVIGEAGWATQTNGNVQIQPGAPSEEKQQIYYQQLMAWTAQEKVFTFVFEAFDENWKGGDSPAETEKHWGLFNSNRTPKLVMKDKFADLMPTKL